uniref:Ovule protein n=1 Tax=Caenorhabditis tropicalis TaxID=1561998 RepID=A0A1I7UYK3_9PELO
MGRSFSRSILKFLKDVRSLGSSESQKSSKKLLLQELLISISGLNYSSASVIALLIKTLFSIPNETT